MNDTERYMVLIVWCEDTEEWGIVNGKANTTWKRFPDTAKGVYNCVKSIHAVGYDAEFLLGGGESKVYKYKSNGGE